MTVAEYIEVLKKQPQDLQVIIGLFSEYVLLEPYQGEIIKACEPRPDGWIACERPDKKLIDYYLVKS
jgi:hypothetical protein